MNQNFTIMKTRPKGLIILLWSARITGTLILAFLLFMVFAHVFGESHSGEGFRDWKEIAAFICFPISSIIGLGMALKWEGIGGIVTIIGMITLIILRPDILVAFLVLTPIVPGFLYAFYWAYTRELRLDSP